MVGGLIYRWFKIEKPKHCDYNVPGIHFIFSVRKFMKTRMKVTEYYSSADMATFSTLDWVPWMMFQTGWIW